MDNICKSNVLVSIIIMTIIKLYSSDSDYDKNNSTK